MHHADFHSPITGRRLLRCARVLLCAGFLVWTAGCQPTRTIVIPGGQGTDHSAPIADLSLEGLAASAWERGNTAEAARLYGVLARNADTSAEERSLAFERLTKAALANRHPHTVLDALMQWRAFDAAAPEQPAWQQAWGRALAQLPSAEGRRRAALVWNDSGRSAALRTQAGGVLLLRGVELERSVLAPQLTALYQNADTAERQLMEHGMSALLGDAPDSDMTALLHLAGSDNDHRFPWSVVLLETVRRERALRSARADELAARISAPGVFADPSLLAAVETPAPQPSAETPPPGEVSPGSGCFVMALPLSGDYAPIGRKVARGAKAAQQEMTRNGLNADLHILDTENPQWLDQLAGLPSQCVVVGGPLRPDAYAAAKARGLTSQRAFFTFFPQLEAQEEGVTAWRFFSSPQDQVEAVLRFARELGLSPYAALYPEEPYGRRMTDLFLQAAGTDVIKTAAYPPEDPKAWNKITREFVGGRMVNKTPVSSAAFRAVFLPDSWDKDAVLIPYLFFHGEDRLLLMGTALWEQSLSGNVKVDTNNLDLAVFPGAWNNATPTAAAASLIETLAATGEQTDFWVGLGYDFVRFASTLGLTDAWTPQEVNTSLTTAQNMPWSMAPIRWNRGKAEQQLFLFTPTASGFEPANPDVFRERLKAVQESHNRRVGSARKGK